MKMILSIAAGGAAGAVARHFAAHWMSLYAGIGVPWGIFSINVLGSFLMGVLVESAALYWSPSPELRGFLMVGVLGGFTTFSTFALDSVLLINKGQWLTAGLYMAASVILSVAALVAGMHLTKIVIMS